MAFLNMPTGRVRCFDVYEYEAKLPQANSLHALTLFQEAINFAHLRQCSLRPAVLFDDRFYLFTEWLHVLWICCQIIERLRETLELQDVIKPQIRATMSALHLKMSTTQTDEVSVNFVRMNRYPRE
jgi:hypothetical protein